MRTSFVSEAPPPGSARAEEIRKYLEAAWEGQFRRPMLTLQTDLHSMGALFAQSATAQKWRAAANDLQPILSPRPYLPKSLFIEVDEERGFVTPEGRAYVEYLDSPGSVDALANTLLAFYGEPRREWIRKEIGGGKAAPPTLGFALFLLFNLNVGAEAAFRIPVDKQEEELVASRVMRVADVFAQSLGSAPMHARELARLKSNWVITETTRKLTKFISSAKRHGTTEIFILDGKVPALEDEIAERMYDRNVTYVQGASALAEAAGAYAAARPVLISLGATQSPVNFERSVCSSIQGRLAMRGDM